MKLSILKHFLQGLLVLFVLYTLTFFLVRSLPGSFFVDEKKLPDHVEERMMEQYGLNKSLPVQYFVRLSQFTRGELGFSTLYKGRDVAGIIGQALPASLKLGVIAMIIAILIGIPAGVIAASRKNSTADYATMALAMLGLCIPTFVLGPLLAQFFGQQLKWLPAAGWGSFSSLSWLLPSITLGLLNAAYLSRLTRTGMLDILSQDFIRTAKAKGVPEQQILLRHALRGGVLPAVAYLGPAFAATVSGSIVIERIFHLPGLGLQFIKAIENKDPFLIESIVLLYGGMVLVAVVFTDVFLVWLNPKLRKTG